MAKLQWHGERVKRDIRTGSLRTLQRIARIVYGAYRRNLSRPAVYIGGGNWIGSSPGEYPRMRSGKLLSRVVWWIDPVKRTLTFGLLDIPGETVDYGEVLERGSVDGKLQPRPWILRTIQQQYSNIQRAVGG